MLPRNVHVAASVRPACGRHVGRNKRSALRRLAAERGSWRFFHRFAANLPAGLFPLVSVQMLA